MKLLSHFKKKKKKPLKSELRVNQVNHTLNISGMLQRENYQVIALCLQSRDKEIEKEIRRISPSSQFEFSVPLNELLTLLKNETKDTFDWYLKIGRPYSDLSEAEKERKDIELNKRDNQLYAEYLIRLGRFQHTKIEELNFYFEDENSLINYVTTKGNLSLLLHKDVESPTKIQIDKLKSKKNKLRIEGKLFTRNSKINNGELIIRGRDTHQVLSSSQVAFHFLKEETEKKYGLNRYEYVAEFNLTNIKNDELLQEDIYDLFLRLELNDKFEDKYIRVGRPTFRARLLLKDFNVKNQKEAIVVNPYFTFKYNNLSLEVYRYPLETFHYLQKLMRWSWGIKFFNMRNNVWIVGERIYKAQDTGYAFFKYMRTQHPEKKVFYIIDKDSPEKHNVEKYGNVLYFKSKEHIFYSLIAKKVISSHHPDYLYPLRTNRFKRKVKADKVFLQHGVMGTKNMVANYGKNAYGFDTDLFMVSSDFEKEMIINDFGYSPKQVFVTGLSRFDTLFKDDVEKKKQILIIPTWRDWIISDEAFFESEYYERYEQIINSKELHQLAKDYSFDIVFCLHPNMQRFSKYFENPSVKVINQGEVNVQHLIKESALMITDYSSVGFDFSFLYKPVLYYQFDRQRFIGKKPSHLNLDEDLPGEICFEQEEIISFVNDYANENFVMKAEYKNRANKFITYRDQSACERIYKVISENKVNKKIVDDPKIDILKKGLYNRFRKSKYYFPSMKLFYRVGAKIIPVDKNLILFESNLGKQYGDSPRNIYEEILRQNLSYKKVWIYNKQYRFKDPTTKRVQRLSPAYFYYLLKAGYWINNQNFPAYIKKRNQTTYLQTWHGTPLKKMLYDIKEVHGRSDDYVERVGNAVKNWDYLISQSPYATKTFKSAFRYNKEILEVGYPRNDIFYKKEKEQLKEQIKRRLNLNENKKIILYAPTFRDDQTLKKNKFLFDLKMDLFKMKEQMGDDYILLLRMHVVVSNKITIEDSLLDFVYNVSNYPDMQELLLIADILITDYSSVMFDFANTGKPILFFTYDLEYYRDNLRGFYMNFEEEAPGPLVYDTDQIIENVLAIEEAQTRYKQKYMDFQKKYCPLDDGLASKRVVDRLFR
ncbi:CDP-glycerol glycerophosphotransferase family protein [Pueribacillus theae]|nr:CDP-glycerol glycerophosphotransferase family protein [Pueribacillus theae]